MVVGIRYQRGHAITTLYDPNGAPITNADGTLATANNVVSDIADAEYNLHQYAKDTAAHQEALGGTAPAVSAVYELLRFGRVINTANETLTPADTPFWQQVNNRGATRWVNLNAANIRKFSDADFAQWKQWKLIDDDSSPDSHCDSATIRAWLDPEGKGLTPTSAMARLNAPDVAAKLKRSIFKFPTEWDASTVEARWGWRRTQTAENPTPMTVADFGKMQVHIAALAFWQAASATLRGPTRADNTPGTLLPANHWHFEPREFIGHFRTCGWIDKNTLARIYKSTSEDVREKYRVALNRMLQKYIFTTAERQIHLFGQGANESGSLTNMVEASQFQTIMPDGSKIGGSINPASKHLEADLGHWYGAVESEIDTYYSGGKYNSKGTRITGSYSWVLGNCGDTDAQKFRGRGFKQLTGRSNYAKYWVYRAWLKASDFDDGWWTDSQWKAKNVEKMKLRPAPIDDPQKISVDPVNTMDSGGWYLCFERPNVKRSIDADNPATFEVNAKNKSDEAIVLSVTQAINGGDIGFADRLKRTRQAKIILLDSTLLIDFKDK